MRERYQQIEAKLQQVPFETLWDGFHAYSFALYNSEMVTLRDKEIPWDKRFLGCTTINFEGQEIAIWDLGIDDQKDNDRLAANLVHEMFHSFQKEQGETRFPDELALIGYPLNEENSQMKARENQALAAFMRHKEKTSLQQVFQSRQDRKELIDQHLQNELRVETIEGAAEFVGMQALKYLNEEKYESQLKSYLNYLEKPSPMLLHTRRISYYAGAVFLLASREAGIAIPMDLSKRRLYLKV